MSKSSATAVLVPGAWADGSSWNRVVLGLRSNGINAVTTPLPLTTLADDVATLDRTLERTEGPVILVGHAYAGAVIGSTRDPKIKGLVYIALCRGLCSKRIGGRSGGIGRRPAPDLAGMHQHPGRTSVVARRA